MKKLVPPENKTKAGPKKKPDAIAKFKNALALLFRVPKGEIDDQGMQYKAKKRANKKSKTVTREKGSGGDT